MAMTLTSEPAAGTGRPHVRVLADRCAGCQECVIRCPTAALGMDAERWVATADDERCVGCRQCVRTCPFSAIEVEGPVLVAPRGAPRVVHPERLVGDVSEVRRGFTTWEEAVAEAQRCLSCPDPTCVRGCPAHNDIPGFVAAVRDRDLPRAHDVLRRTSVLPDVCSRVCNQAAQCEGACTWSLAGGQPVAIGNLERFVTDHSPVPPPAVPPAAVGLTVAVVGAGPGGIGAAWALAEAGALVTVFERDQVPSGLLGWGIPDFTLPDAVAGRPWEQLTAAGVDLRCGEEVDAARIDHLLQVYDAVIVATGASSPLRLPVPGAELGGVTDATVFLKSARAALAPDGDPDEWRAAMDLGPVAGAAPHVLVLGAGNTAMDVARTARRLGCSATCVDWLDERFALARPDELAEARHEGVDVRFTTTVARLEGEGDRVRRALLSRTVQERADRTPTVVGGPAEPVACDLVVMAMGYRVDPAIAGALPGTPVHRRAEGLADRRWMASGLLAPAVPVAAGREPVGALALGREVAMQAAALAVRERLWVVGDALVGPSTVVEAMAQGRRAAAAVLAAEPTCPGAWRPGRAGRALVCYASRGGRTARAARAVADQLRAGGMRVRTLPLERVGPEELAAADLVVVGTWVEGLVVAKVGPARSTRAWLAHLPRLGGMPVALFCTYGVAPRGTLAAMAAALEDRGARVVASAAFGRGVADEGAATFARRVLGALRPAVPGLGAAVG